MRYREMMKKYGIKAVEMPLTAKAYAKKIVDIDDEKEIERLDNAIVSMLLTKTKGLTVEEYKEFKKTGKMPEKAPQQQTQAPAPAPSPQQQQQTQAPAPEPAPEPEPERYRFFKKGEFWII